MYPECLDSDFLNSPITYSFSAGNLDMYYLGIIYMALLKESYIGSKQGTAIRDIKRDTRSLDCSMIWVIV